MTTISGFHHVSLTVGDLARSADFYTDTFGFVRVLELPDEGGRGAKLVLAHPESRTILGFTVHQAGDGSPFSEFRTGLDHLSFAVPSRDDLERWVARFDELGIPHGGVTETPIGALVAVRDPDNIQVELWADASG